MKLLKFLFKRIINRFTFVLATLFLQLGILIAIIIKSNQYFTFFYGFSLMASIIAVLLIINNKSHPDYKVAWIIPILSFPIFGGLFYLFFGRSKLSRGLKRKMYIIEDKTRESIKPQNETLAQIAKQNITAANQSRYIQDYAYCPPYANSYSKYLTSGEETFEIMKEELRKAEKYIFLEFYIIEEGVMWNSILEILAEKAAQGVDVRVIYDGIGCQLKLPFRYNKKLEKMGIKCCIFNPISPVLTLRYNNRDHRKIVVIDGKVGFTGGVNLADEYINLVERFGHWKDTGIMLKGEAVWSLTVIFLSMWDYLTGVEEDFSLYKAEEQSDVEFAETDNTGENTARVGEKGDKEQPREGSLGCVQPFADSPLDDEPVGETVYLNLINKAKKYVYITTPYLIIDNEMKLSLTAAAKSGVDVRIITPRCGDSDLVHEVTRSYYKDLIVGGVKIYEYEPGFIHSKTYLVDDEYGVVGTINMDYRSLYLHFECAVWLYNTSSVDTMKEDFFNILKVSRQITWEDVRQIKWYRSFLHLFLRVFAPLL